MQTAVQSIDTLPATDYIKYWDAQKFCLTDVWFYLNANSTLHQLAAYLNDRTGNAYSYKRVHDWKNWNKSKRKPPKVIQDLMRQEILTFLFKEQLGNSVWRLLHC